MTLHGSNLLFLLLPFTLFYGAYLTKIVWFRKFLIMTGFISLVALPVKLINKPDIIRAKQDTNTFNRHQVLPDKVIIVSEPYDSRMAKRSKEITEHATDKLNTIIGETKK